MVRVVPLRRKESGRQETCRRQPATAAHEWDERDEPDQILRRENLAESHEGADAGGRVTDESARLHLPAREADPETEQRRNLNYSRDHGERLVPGDAHGPE